ncbi:sensor histidine kinase [Amycolatopsis pigmentata]|uniref:histidine kinase n=1 Tax=Amycolatopsis pigmentata TaxID=450801 RepID=A0ABW5FWM6_9PSEU
MLKRRVSFRTGIPSVPRGRHAERGGYRDFLRVRSLFAVVAVAVCALAGLPRVSLLPASAAVTAVIAATAGAIQRPRGPWVVSAGALVAAGVSAVATVTNHVAGTATPIRWLLMETAFSLVIVVQVARTAPTRVLLPVGLIVGAAIVASPSRISDMPTFSGSATVISMCSCWAVLVMCAAAVGMYLRHLDESRNRSVATARREQRLQLARDLHDWLAHEVTGIVLEAQAARVDGGDPAGHGAALMRIEEAGVRALDAMDRAIGLMRGAGECAGSSSPERLRLADLREVVRRFSVAGPVGVSLDMVEVDDTGPEAAAVAHRLVVEALTNVRRHASSVTVVRIRVARTGGNLVVSVTDDGEHRPASRSLSRSGQGGSGLPGLAEQVETLGGSFSAGPLIPQGWFVCAVIPDLR